LKIDVSLLHFETEIGRGHFGIVSRATYTTANGTRKKVACKFLKESVAGVGDFILEGLTMGRFNHPHLMQLIGIAFADGRIPIIVTDYMENGDLRSYLRDISKIITIRKLLKFACQIAEGMKHLHLCRLDSDLNIKIGDFGLCRRVSDESECYKPSHKHRDVPFPWMAPEAMRSETFTFQNDVWAYGVVLWELTTRGLMPYAGKSGIEILEFLRADNRLEMPEYCPSELYNEIMLPCWHTDPQQRPTFADLVTLMSNLVASMESSQLNRLSCNYEKVSSTVFLLLGSNCKTFTDLATNGELKRPICVTTTCTSVFDKSEKKSGLSI
uniref:Protein kinase domain-containing protein n=1 Tax=Angiostrongylus cantonensis TaxID=6313 RepID=A0A0K0DRD8_ANGCA